MSRPRKMTPNELQEEYGINPAQAKYNYDIGRKYVAIEYDGDGGDTAYAFRSSLYDAEEWFWENKKFFGNIVQLAKC